MPLTGLLRVKNESKYLGRAVKSIKPICERVYVMDDHSTDNTRDIAYDLGCVVLRSPFPVNDLDEARDNTWLLDAALARVYPSECGPLSSIWFLHMDGDEELVERDRVKLNDDMFWGTPQQYCVQILYLWGDEQTVRVDAHYSKCYKPALFRAVSHGMTYQNHSGKIHSTGVPREIGYSPRLHDPEPVRLLHYGYMDSDVRQKKFEWYMSVDSKQEEFYRRECFGPAETVPLSSILK